MIDGPATVRSSALRPTAHERLGVLEQGALTDAQLVALAREEPAQALEAIYTMYRSRIYTFLLRFIEDPEAAADVTQETFTKAFRAFGQLTNEHRVLPWLYRIANNAAIDHVRRRRRIPWLRLGAITDTHDEPHAVDEHSAVGERHAVQKVLRALPPENAMALLLHALEGYSYKEIAEIQGCTMTAVRSRIARARAAFRKAYVSV